MYVDDVKPAPTEIVLSLGYLTITTPEPPAAPVVEPRLSPPPPPPPVLAVPAAFALPP